MRVLSFLAAAVVGTALAQEGKAVSTDQRFVTPILADTNFGDDDKFPTVQECDSFNNCQTKCAEGLYLGTSIQPTLLHKVEADGTGLSVVGSSDSCDNGNTGVTYNAIGYNVADHFMYAVTDHQSDNQHHLVRINNKGCVEVIANLGALDDNNGKHVAGDVYLGSLWASTGSHFRQIGLNAGASGYPVIEWSFSTCTKLNDFAFASATFPLETGNAVGPGTAFGFDVAEQKFCMFSATGANPTPTLLTNMGVAAQIGDNAKIGGFFMDKDGAVFIYDNNTNQLFKYTGLSKVMKGEQSTLDFQFSVFVGTADFDNVDGVSCVDASAGLEAPCSMADQRCCPRD